MELSLNTQTQQLLDSLVNSGKYASPEDVVAAALHALANDEAELATFAPGELDRLIEEGLASGPPLDGETVLKELRELREAKSQKARR